MSTIQHRTGIESLDIVPIVVGDLDEALEFYTGALGFEVRMDEEFELEGETGRWLTVGDPGQELQIGLMPAEVPYYDDESREILGAKPGSQTWYTVRTDDCAASVVALEDAGVEITQAPKEYPWGTEAMFADPDGNAIDANEFELVHHRACAAKVNVDGQGSVCTSLQEARTG
jgi:predicted enzyme related to lactoylglutathione lyase